MTNIRRLQAAAAFSAAVFAATCWQIGEVVSGHRPPSAYGRGVGTAAERNPIGIESTGIFASRPVITYSAPAGSFFAWQMKPDLGATVARPRDLIVIIDTSASQAGSPMKQARELTAELAKQAGRGDRIAIWTVDTPEWTRDLTKGLRVATDTRITDALTQLEKSDYAAGTTDLKNGLKRIMSALPSGDDRRLAIVYLGDGDSVLNPMSDVERNRIAADLADRQVSVFTVPLGRKINAKTIHGLSSATGGSVMRLAHNDKASEAAERMLKNIDAPVLFPTKTDFTNAVVEAMPTRLPPLRGDMPTLVAGQFRGETVECRVEGTVNGKPVAMVLKDQLPPTDSNNYFLMNLVKQWSDADRSAPAVMRADRGLALSFEQTRLARDEFLTQAQWAMGMDKYDAAEHLFQTAGAIDPLDAEAAGGAKIAQQLRSGKTTKTQLAKDVRAMGGNVELVKATSTELTQDTPVRPGSEPVSGAALLELEKRRRAVQEQQLTQMVDDAVRQARLVVRTDPDSAYDLLKRQLGSVRDNGDLSDGVRSTLANRLESALRTIQADGARVKLEQDAELRRRIALESRRGSDLVRVADEERIRERVRLFGSLMDRARYEEAYKESLELQRELQAKGRATPPQVHASYVMNTNAAAIRDYDELRRVKEERFLLTMFQVDKSHVPFPDEPPVAYPPAAYWKEITEMRKDRYASDGLGGYSRKAIELRDQLARPVTLSRAFDGVPLKDVLADFGELYNITFLINPVPFKAEGGDDKIEDKPVRIPKMPGVSLSTLLSYALSNINATYLIRKDYVEITTRKAAGLEKTVRAYAVADLVIPIPNAVDPQSLQQNLQVLGSSLSANGQAIFGAAGGGLNLGNFGQLGGGIQQFGGGFGQGGFGGGGGGGGQAFLGGGGGQFQGGAIGFGGGTGQNNLGFGGGALGFGGGQQGQFGNLGGQFGLQGGDTSNILIKLIEDTIAPREWNTTAARYLNPNGVQADEDLPPLDIALLNSMGYYQPARALVVRGSARVHSRIGDFTAPSAPGAGAKNKVDRGDDVLVFGPGAKKAPVQPVAVAKPEPVKKDEPVVAAKEPHDIKKVWNDTMAQGHFKPRNVIGVASVLSVCAKFDEAAEVLKADLRHGVLAHPCVFDALAVALQESGASIEEIERAKLSKIDLDPTSALNFLDVAQAVTDLGRHDRALEYCKRAAALEPNTPEAYHKTLVMIGTGEKATAEAVQWAAGNLLQRDWGTEGARYQDQAKKAIDDLAARLDKAGQKADAAQVRAIADQHRQRDLVIETKWAEQADIDMSVAEPAGTVCASRMPRTPAGGLWSGDNLNKNEESYVAARAFSGSYEITVRRVWGKPLADKVSVRVIKNQGGDNEAVELHTLVLDSKGEAKLKINMANGRREQLDSVPVTATVKRLPVSRQTPDEINNLLRSMADPMLAISRPGMTGGSSAGGTMTETARATLGLEPGVELSHQTKVSPALSSGVDLLTKTTISGDRSTMKVSLSPAFDAKTVSPRVPLAAVPGGN